jgi:hypothetical protein
LSFFAHRYSIIVASDISKPDQTKLYVAIACICICGAAYLLDASATDAIYDNGYCFYGTSAVVLYTYPLEFVLYLATVALLFDMFVKILESVNVNPVVLGQLWWSFKLTFSLSAAVLPYYMFLLIQGAADSDTRYIYQFINVPMVSLDLSVCLSSAML